jgi:ribosomal protein L11 methyltransferase
MRLLRLRCRASEKDQLSGELYELGTLGVREIETPEDGGIEIEAWFETEVEATRLSPYGARWEAAPESDWVEESRRGWEPFGVGAKLWIVPDWRDDPTPEGRLRLITHPGNASGSGYSTPTQLALEAIEKHLRAGDTVLDAGAGSGILTAAAALLGARKLIACDIDPEAARTAAANLQCDGIEARVFAGSPRALRKASATLVAANLNAVALIGSASELARVLTPEGRLIACGFRERRQRDVARAFESRGLVVRDRMGREDWRCLVLSAVP